MQAVTAPTPGAPEALVLGEIETPEPGPGEALVRVHAAGLNRADLMQRRGLYSPPEGATPVLGLEAAGEIVALGPATPSASGDSADAADAPDAADEPAGDSESGAGWQVGDRVAALLSGGGYGEYVAVPLGQLLPLPPSLSFVEGAALPEALATVYSNVLMTARLAPGEWLLAHGGGSGIGTMAIQVAKALGNPVAVTVGSERKAEFCRSLGADLVINYHEEDFVARTKEATGGVGVNVILDLVGGPYLERNIAALAPDGRLVVIAVQGGPAAELNLGALMKARASVIATTLRARPAEQKAEIVTRLRDHLWPSVASGAIRPIVDQVLPLAEAARAHQILEERDNIGKIILEVTP